jgi:hypothetical protein
MSLMSNGRRRGNHARGNKANSSDRLAHMVKLGLNLNGLLSGNTSCAFDFTRSDVSLRVVPPSTSPTPRQPLPATTGSGHFPPLQVS